MSVKAVSETKYLEVHFQNQVATISFNRPEVMNAFNREMWIEFNQLLKEISEIKSVHIVILKGNGNAFCAGADIKNMSPDMDSSITMDIVSEIAVRLYTYPKLTISAIHGAAAGGGLSLALATDYSIAHANSKIAMNFNGIGLIPDIGAHFFLLQKLGEAKTKQLIWNSGVLSSPKAHEIGLIDEITDDLQNAVLRQVNKWLESPLQALIQTKLITSEIHRNELIKILELEKIAQLKLKKTHDHLEGVNAFKEKRKPVFTGE